MADWSQLPNELLEEIIARLNSSIHTIRLRAVCSAWRAVVSSCSSYLTSSVDIGGGYLLSKRTIFLLSRPPKPNSFSSANRNTEFDDNAGSSWLIKVEENGKSGLCRLFNPLSQAQFRFLSPYVIDLLNFRVRELGAEYVINEPNGTRTTRFRIEKLVYLQKNDSDFLLLVQFSELLIINSRGEEVVIDTKGDKVIFDDLMVFDGIFYALDYNGRTISIECVDFPNVVVTEVAKSGVYGISHIKRLMTVGKDLMMVDTAGEVCGAEPEDMEWRVMWNEKIVQFKVYKLDKSKCDWVEVDSLDDNVLFLGDNSSFSASASELFYSKGNCIYFNKECSSRTITIDEVDNIGLFAVENDETVEVSYQLFRPPPPH